MISDNNFIKLEVEERIIYMKKVLNEILNEYNCMSKNSTTLKVPYEVFKLNKDDSELEIIKENRAKRSK